MEADAQKKECTHVTTRYVVPNLGGVDIGSNYESVARWWLSSKKNDVLNVISAAALWSVCNLRNAMCFQGMPWPGLKGSLEENGELPQSMEGALRRCSLGAAGVKYHEAGANRGKVL